MVETSLQYGESSSSASPPAPVYASEYAPFSLGGERTKEDDDDNDDSVSRSGDNDRGEIVSEAMITPPSLTPLSDDHPPPSTSSSSAASTIAILGETLVEKSTFRADESGEVNDESMPLRPNSDLRGNTTSRPAHEFDDHHHGLPAAELEADSSVANPTMEHSSKVEGTDLTLLPEVMKNESFALTAASDHVDSSSKNDTNESATLLSGDGSGPNDTTLSKEIDTTPMIEEDSRPFSSFETSDERSRDNTVESIEVPPVDVPQHATSTSSQQSLQGHKKVSESSMALDDGSDNSETRNIHETQHMAEAESDDVHPALSSNSSNKVDDLVDTSSASSAAESASSSFDADDMEVNPMPAAQKEVEVIELLDSDDDDEEENPPSAAAAAAAAAVSQASQESNQIGTMNTRDSVSSHVLESYKRQKLSNGLAAPPSLGGAGGTHSVPNPLSSIPRPAISRPQSISDHQPVYVRFPANFRPSWSEMLPNPASLSSVSQAPANPQPQTGAPRLKYFKLSLLNVNEFTITGLSAGYDSPPTSIAGLRVPIRKISRDHGKAVFDKDKDDDGPGRWRIPLGAYQPFYSWLNSNPYTRVEGIPPHQLQIASLERARQEKGYPTEDALVEKGVPRQVAKALAPFQRGGVDFVIQKGGRALIADDMGLGKTIQGIASMSVYMDQWPVLVLCPSSARYHWEGEFLRWLGAEDGSNSQDGKESSESTKDSGDSPLESWQINVLSASKADLFPYPDTKIVICTYGLAPTLVQMGKLAPGMFGCAIVDESHMLKNKASKRSKALVPLLSSIPRCVLLSGTPALARPVELWPQLEVLGVSGRNGFWDNEADFLNKYVKKGGSTEKAELHTMLTGTIMIRRLKNDILKDLPRKLRSQAILHILNSDQCREFKGLLAQLRESKGTLGNIARSHHADLGDTAEGPEPATAVIATTGKVQPTARVDAEMALRADLSRRLQEGRLRIHESLSTNAFHLNTEQRNSLLLRLEGELQVGLDKQYAERSAALDSQLGTLPANPAQGQGEEESKRTTLLSHMYALTGDVKIPLIVDMLRRWLADPTKGKLCIFAHHLSVLNSIRDQAELSNDSKSNRKFIRIDGATLPRQRQEQIKKFQTDPSVRVALLGITAAGVAVTLTASSTVWFAELFWTPALMIQAEDRCHRIGQQARVNCLYFVARGTLDEILWKLIENKFQDLGEFVEGKEKLKLVVEKVFESEKELHSMFDIPDDDEDEAEYVDDETGIDKELTFDDFAEDIAKLGLKECAMLRIDSDDEEDAEGTAPKVRSDDHRKVAAIEGRKEDSLGRSEEEAIVLLDDDDDEEDTLAAAKPSSTEPMTLAAASAGPAVLPQNPPAQVHHTLSDCRLYKLLIDSPQLGVELSLHRGRPVVVRITKERLERVGYSGKPALGDILVAVDGQPLPLARHIDEIVRFIKAALHRRPFEITCADYPSFKEIFFASREAIKRQYEERRALKNRAAAENVIEIDDDDEDD